MKIFKTKAQREEDRKAKQLETDKKNWRKPEIVGREYGNLCSEAGDKQYRLKVLETELEGINKRLHLLNQEYAKAVEVHGEPKLTQELPPGGSTMSKAEFEEKTKPVVTEEEQLALAGAIAASSQVPSEA